MTDFKKGDRISVPYSNKSDYYDYGVLTKLMNSNIWAYVPCGQEPWQQTAVKLRDIRRASRIEELLYF
jgi:hypothetical protein